MNQFIKSMPLLTLLTLIVTSHLAMGQLFRNQQPLFPVNRQPANVVQRPNATTSRFIDLRIQADFITSARFSPDGQRVITEGNTIQTWDANSGRLLQTQRAPVDAPAVSSSDKNISPDGKRTAKIEGDTIIILDAESGRELQRLVERRSIGRDGEFYIKSLVFSPDGKKIVTVGSIETFASSTMSRSEVERRNRQGPWEFIIAKATVRIWTLDQHVQSAQQSPLAANSGDPRVRRATITAEEKVVMAEALHRTSPVSHGAFAPEFDGNGVLLRLYIQGFSMVTDTTLQPTQIQINRARQTADQNAEHDVRDAFIKFLREEVSVLRNEQERVTIIMKKGSVAPPGYGDVTLRAVNEIRSNVADNLYLRGRILLDGHSSKVESLSYPRRPGGWSAEVVYGWSTALAEVR